MPEAQTFCAWATCLQWPPSPAVPAEPQDADTHWPRDSNGNSPVVTAATATTTTVSVCGASGAAMDVERGARAEAPAGMEKKRVGSYWLHPLLRFLQVGEREGVEGE